MPFGSQRLEQFIRYRRELVKCAAGRQMEGIGGQQVQVGAPPGFLGHTGHRQPGIGFPGMLPVIFQCAIRRNHGSW